MVLDKENYQIKSPLPKELENSGEAAGVKDAFCIRDGIVLFDCAKGIFFILAEIQISICLQCRPGFRIRNQF